MTASKEQKSKENLKKRVLAIFLKYGEKQNVAESIIEKHFDLAISERKTTSANQVYGYIVFLDNFIPSR